MQENVLKKKRFVPQQCSVSLFGAGIESKWKEETMNKQSELR